MKALLILGFSLIASASALANENCYQLSPDGSSWGRELEVLCVQEGTNPAVITLKREVEGVDFVVAQFNMELLLRARCADCNADQYGIAYPRNSVFKALTVQFEGRRYFTGSNFWESGTVTVGAVKFHYRKI